MIRATPDTRGGKETWGAGCRAKWASIGLVWLSLHELDRDVGWAVNALKARPGGVKGEKVGICVRLKEGRGIFKDSEDAMLDLVALRLFPSFLPPFTEMLELRNL